MYTFLRSFRIVLSDLFVFTLVKFPNKVNCLFLPFIFAVSKIQKHEVNEKIYPVTKAKHLCENFRFIQGTRCLHATEHRAKFSLESLLFFYVLIFLYGNFPFINDKIHYNIFIFP